MRSDPALCFKALCGEAPVSVRKKKKGKQLDTKLAATPGGKVGGANNESEASDSGEEEEDSEGEEESGPSTPAATPSGKRYNCLFLI